MNFISKLIAISPVSRNIVKVSYRNYPRWTSRTPLKVLESENEQEHEVKHKKDLQKANKAEENLPPIEEAIKIKWRYQVDTAAQSQEVEVIEREKKTRNKKPKSAAAVPETTDMLETIINEKGQFVYSKMTNNDPRIGQLLTTVKAKKIMSKKDLILLEGKRLIRDALLAGCSLKYLLFTRKTEIEYLKPDLPRCGAKMYKMPYREMQMWSDLTTTPGIMGLFRTPNSENYISKKPIPLTIYCDNIREPGNLGAILRVAASAGCQKVILSTGCTSLWDTKVTRSSAGSQFRVKILPKTSIEGLREELCDPNAPKILFIADNKLLNTDCHKKDNEDQGLIELINQIPIIPYYGVNVREANMQGKEIVLVIGGETQGINADVYKLAKEFNGARLNIPMSNGVESLNTGTAAGIITFEFYRQFMTSGNLN